MFLASPNVSFADTENLIANPSLETASGASPENWLQSQWGNLQANFEYPVAGHSGDKAAKVTVSSYAEGDAKWYFDDVPVTVGAQYLFSDWSNASVDTLVVVRMHLSNGADQYLELGTVTGANSWQQYNATFIAPVGAVSATVFHLINKNGSLMVDDYSLTEVPPVVITPTTNLIGNPYLETASGSLPLGWSHSNWGALSASFSYPILGHTGNAAKINISSYTNGDAKWIFSDVPVTVGNFYKFSNWSKASVNTEAVAKFHMSDGTDQYMSLGIITGTNAWKQFESSFVAPAGSVSVTVFHLIAKKGTLIVDDYSLLDTGVAPKFSEGMVSFTFDDGYENIFTAGIPILDEAGIKSTQAIITKKFTDPLYMTKAQVQELAENGHEISSHTRTHPNLTTLTKAKATTEIVGSKSDLAALGITANSFMYPLGAYNDSIQAIVKNAGYAGARISDEGYNNSTSRSYQILSQNVNNDVSIETIKSWIDTAIANKTWVVLMFHQQAKLPNTPENLYSNDPEILQQIVDYVQLKDVKTVTFGQGVSMLGE